jgi:hypothetical protein
MTTARPASQILEKTYNLYHQNEGEKTDAFAVRCIKNIDTSK